MMEIGRNGCGGAVGGLDAFEGCVRRFSLGQKYSNPACGVVAVQERTMGGAVAHHPVEDHLDRRGKAEHATGCSEYGRISRVEHEPTAGGDDQTRSLSKLGCHLGLDLSEGVFTLLGEDHGNRSVVGLDQLVGVDELEFEQLGQSATDGGLARAHESGEHDVSRQ